MTTPVTPIPVTVDYTGRDFYSLREALIARVQNRVPNWYGNDENDFGVALVEAFAYMGDVVSYYADRVANESNLLTATQRASVLAIARGYGYDPVGYQSASVSLTLYNDYGSALTIAAGTEFVCSVVSGDAVRQLIFYTTEEVTIPAKVGSVLGNISVLAKHGENVSLRTSPATLYSSDGELLGYSDGTPRQTFTLKENQVVDDTVTVYVKNGANFEPWSQVLHIADYGPDAAVYSITTDDNNYVTVEFGDGISGAIPPMHFEIRAKYVVGGGAVGNIPAQTSLLPYAYPSTVTSGDQTLITGNVTAIAPLAATGGVDPESLDVIRQVAPLAFSAANRAVTLGDYISLALSAKTTGKANAVADIWSSVTVFAAPLTESDSADLYPLFDETNTNLNTTYWDGFKADVTKTLAGKTQVGTTVTIAPPKYINVVTEIKYSLFPGFTAAQVEADLRTFMESYYGYSSMQFGQVIPPEEIEFILRYVQGISNVRVEKLYRVGETVDRTVLVGRPNEIFVFGSLDGTTSRTSISAYSTISTLSALTTGGSPAVAFSPTFQDTFNNYTVGYNSGTSSATVTPTAADTKSVIRVNGTVTASGSAASITLGSSGSTTKVTITVTAEDKITTSTYYLSINRA